MTFYASYPFTGGSGGVTSYANLAAFPSAATAGNGALAIALDTDILYISNGSAWLVLANPAISPLAITALTGDGTATGPGSVPLTLATVNSNVGSFGSATQVGTFTVNAKGLVTAAASTSIQIAESQVTNLVADLASKQSATLTNAHILVGNVSNVATDVAASGDLSLANTGVFTFNTVNSNVGSFGSASSVTALTVNAKGLTTAASSVSIQIAESQVTNLVADLASKQSATLTNAHILVGNVSNVATDVAMTGDVGISNAGLTTIANLAVTNAKIANATIDLTAKVTGVLPIANGGTNASSLTSGKMDYFDGTRIASAAAVDYSTSTQNVLITASASNVKPLIAKGAASQSVSLQEWQNSSGTALATITAAGNIDSQGTTINLGTNSGGTGAAATIAITTTNNTAFTFSSQGQNAILYCANSGQQTVGAAFGSTTAGTRTTVGSQLASAGGGTYINFSTNGGNNGLHFTHNYGSDLFTMASSGATTFTAASSVVLLGLKAAAAQAVNIQEWQNSSGTALTSIASDGKINSAAFTASNVLVTDSSKNIVTAATLSLALGGTGTAAGSANAAFNALAPTTTKGDLIAFSTVNARVAVGTNGTVLTADSTAATGVSWQAPSGGTGVAAKNALINSGFPLWQRGTSVTVANAATGYLADRWYVKNSLGTNGVITYSQVAAVTSGSSFGAKVQITTAPTAAQTNGTEFYQTLENQDSILFLNQVASFSILVKSFGNVNQVGVALMYKTTEAKVDTVLGAETTVSVNSATFTACTVPNISVSTTPTTAGVIGVRIRITGVSSGNTYDLNNGFVVEQGILNIGATAAAWNPAGKTFQQEVALCQRFYEKNYPIATAPGSVVSNEIFAALGSSTNTQAIPGASFRVTKFQNPTVTLYNPDTGSSGSVVNSASSSNVAATAGLIGPHGFGQLSGGAVFTSQGRVLYMFTADAEI